MGTPTQVAPAPVTSTPATQAQTAPVQAPAPQAVPVQRKFDTAQLIAAMLKLHGHVSDLIFSPGRAPQIEVSGQLVELKFKGLESLTAQDTYNIARDLMG